MISGSRHQGGTDAGSEAHRKERGDPVSSQGDSTSRLCRRASCESRHRMFAPSSCATSARARRGATRSGERRPYRSPMLVTSQDASLQKWSGETDPQAQRLAEPKQRVQRTQTFRSLCERFLLEARTKDNLPLRPTTLYNWRNIAKVEIIPALGDRAPEEITRRDVRGLVEAIAVERPYWANRVFELVRRVFSWGVEKDLIGGSPCVGLKKPGGERPRDRVLASEEIRSVWAALTLKGLLERRSGCSSIPPRDRRRCSAPIGLRSTWRTAFGGFLRPA